VVIVLSSVHSLSLAMGEGSMYFILRQAVLDQISSAFDIDVSKQSATAAIRRSKSHDSDVTVVLSSIQPNSSRPDGSLHRCEVMMYIKYNVTPGFS